MRRIVVSLRSCPTRLLGPYGCEWTETPNLDRLAAEGVVFDGHYARLSGIDAASFPYAQTIDGFDTDHVLGHFDQLSEDENGLLIVQLDLCEMPRCELQAGPIDLEQAPIRESLFETSMKLLSLLDQRIELYLKALAERGLNSSTVFLFTSCSGLPLGEHGILGTAGSRLHEELVHLPLIVRFADCRLAGYRVPGYTMPDDLDELLTAGATEPLEALILGRTSTRESISTALGDPPREAALRTVDSCLILPLANSDSPPLLFDRPDDRFEVNDLHGRQPDRADELKRRLCEQLNGESMQRSHVV